MQHPELEWVLGRGGCIYAVCCRAAALARSHPHPHPTAPHHHHHHPRSRSEEAEPSASQEEKKKLKPFAPKHREETRLDMFVLVKRAFPYSTSNPIWWPARKIDDATELRAAAQNSSCSVGFSDIVSGVGEEVIVQYIDGRAEANLVQKKMEKKTMVQPFYLQVTNENPKC